MASQRASFRRSPLSAKYASTKILTELQGNAKQLNTGDPFVKKNLPGYDSYQYEGTLSGPINKNASFFFTAQHRNIQDDSIISAERLNGEINGDFAAGNYGVATDYNTSEFNDALFTPESRTNISRRTRSPCVTNMNGTYRTIRVFPAST
jgi:hypothetical protein